MPSANPDLSNRTASRTPRTSGSRDVAFLALVATLPALFYLWRMGFYLDDYYELELMKTLARSVTVGSFDALLSGDPKSHLRPVEYFGLAVLYRLFGTDPLPYHIFLALLVPLCSITAYLVLRAAPTAEVSRTRGAGSLRERRRTYSSDRFWVVAYSPTVSLTLYLISLYCGLRAFKHRVEAKSRWVVGAVVSMLASIFMYEIALPLFVVTALYFWYRSAEVGATRLPVPSSRTARRSH